MSYEWEIKPSCQEDIKKFCKKNHILEKVISNKIKEIIENPQHYKPLRYGLAGERRVHILKSFVLIFEINEEERLVTFILFAHHDDAYRR